MMLKELIDLLSNIESLADTDLPIYFDSGKEINGVAFVERPHSVCPEHPSIMIY